MLPAQYRLALAAAILITSGGCTVHETPPAASLPCPVWAADPADPHANEAAAGLGCVNRHNLEVMLERKEDLVEGRKLGPADGARQAIAIENYEKARPTGPATNAVPGAAFPAMTPTPPTGAAQ